LEAAMTFTSHSLRRGFATWANADSWDVKTLMEYVGWKNAQTAIRYIEAPAPFAQHRVGGEVKAVAIEIAIKDPARDK
jgi:integrase